MAMAVSSMQPSAPFSLGNIVAVCIVSEVLQMLSLRSFAVASAVLVGLLLYDVFWVFGSSPIFGDNVMVTVATSDALVGPMKLVFPRWTVPWMKPGYDAILSANATANPAVHEWNLVRVLYCDGGGYAGTKGRMKLTDGTSIYLDGWNVFRSVVQDLRSNRSKEAPTHILLSGSSAGGQAVVNLCDWLAASFPNATTRCLVDSGFFMDAKDRLGKHGFRSLAQSITVLHRPYNPYCAFATNSAQQWKCFFPQYTLRTIATPVFIFHTLFDYIAAMLGNQLPKDNTSRPAATTAAAAARANAAAAGGGAAGSTGGAAGAGPTTDRHCLSWPISWQLQRLGVDSSGHYLSRTTPPLSSFPQRPRDCASQRCVPGHVEAAALGSSESTVALAAGESAAALGARASRCFFRDCTTVTPLATPVLVSLVDPTGGPVVALASTVLPCPGVPSGSLSGLHLPAFSTNLLSNAVLQYEWVDTFIPGGQREAICQVAALIRVSASSQLAASCSYRKLSHQTLLWHHHLGHPSLLRLRSMHSRLLVSGLPRSLPSLPRSLAPPCLPCVEGRQRAAPNSSEIPPTTAPLQTLHMDDWGPAPVAGTDQERYFLLVVDDYTHYTTVFPLRRKADVSGVSIPWIRASRR
ncbi:unnamed protein product [Closterium sp. NIES-53]